MCVCGGAEHIPSLPLASLSRAKRYISWFILHGISVSHLHNQFLFVLKAYPIADLFWTAFSPGSLYNTLFKIAYLCSSAYILYLMLNDYKPTNDPNIDTFKVEYLLGASLLLAILFPNRFEYTPTEILWTFSIWLESVAILPQLFMLQRTGEAETITTHYLFALGIYRAFYILNWIWRFFTDTQHKLEPIAVLAGLLQTILYSDFFYIYYVKVLQGKKFNLPV